MNQEKNISRMTAFLAAVLLIVPTAWAQITINREMAMNQFADGSWVVECEIEYVGIDVTHSFSAGFIVQGPDGSILARQDAEVDAHNRRVRSKIAGVSEVDFKLTGNSLTLSAVVFTNMQAQPSQAFTCQGGALDRTLNLHLPAVIMQHRAQN